jgi:predicted XRE-type DNA-binding protein
MKKNKYIGSSFDSFLEEEGILEEVNTAAIKAVIARNLKQYMDNMHITQTEMARQLKTSRSGLQRLLDPENYSVTLLTLHRVASVLGKKVNIELISIKPRK